MLIDRGALEPAAAHAVVPEQIVVTVTRALAAEEDMRPRLLRAFRRLEGEQPAVADFLATELSAFEAASTQALAYFLFMTVCASFAEAFTTRLAEVTPEDLDRALETLLADGEVRSQTCQAGSFSQDVVAQWQPALMALVQDEIGESRDVPEVDTVLQVLLVVIVALTRAVVEP
jgi:hypothetical protein